MKKIRVVVVDDSAVMRSLLTALIDAAPDLEVVGEAVDANAARQVIRALDPDVITLDVQMPGMSGIEFLERLMRLRPMPVVMVSAFTAAGSEATLRALELGAFDFIGKPRLGDPRDAAEYAAELAEKIRAGAQAKARCVRTAPAQYVCAAAKAVPFARASGYAGSGKIVFVGASTGGTEAIKVFLQGMPANCPPILVVQHMPETFTASFARRLDGQCPPTVIESRGGETVRPGTVHIAPGNSHLLIRKLGQGFVTELQQTAAVNRHRPSVDVLFDSATNGVGKRAIGVLLTGMGKDGADGLVNMRAAGARTFAQDEESCIVFGMPREAILRGGADEVVALPRMADRVLAALAEK